MSGIYIHIPFCRQACSYCDFYFVTRNNHQQEFVNALVDEIHMKKSTRYSRERIQTVYFGGGTPSLLTPAQLEQIFEALTSSFTLDVQECTMELNPDDVTKEYLQSIHAIGINRASMGIQSFDEVLLKFMHRAHSSSEALHCLELLAHEGFDSFTVDLIYGNPNQSEEMLIKDLEILKSFDPPHVSAYSLTIEEGTRLRKQAELGRLFPLSDEKVSRHFEILERTLLECGTEQYEISNFAKPGYEARHNSAYWTHQNYLGLGPAAHSFWWADSLKSAQRWCNKKNLKAYLEGDWQNRYEIDYLDLKALLEERLMLGLRTNRGLNLPTLKKLYDFSFTEKQQTYLKKKEQEGLISINENNVRLTKKGFLITDLIVLDLITA